MRYKASCPKNVRSPNGNGWLACTMADLSRLHLDFTRDNDDLSKELWDFTRGIGDLTEKQIDLTGENCSTYRYKMGINQIWGLRD